jgi:acyl carrier protein
MTVTRQLLLEQLEARFGLDASGIEDTTPLFSSGLLDSFSVAELLMFIEEQGGFRVEPTEITLDNLDSIERILAFAGRKTG